MKKLRGFDNGTGKIVAWSNARQEAQLLLRELALQ